MRGANKKPLGFGAQKKPRGLKKPRHPAKDERGGRRRSDTSESFLRIRLVLRAYWRLLKKLRRYSGKAAQGQSGTDARRDREFEPRLQAD
jgi:hypothetical protein